MHRGQRITSRPVAASVLVAGGSVLALTHVRHALALRTPLAVLTAAVVPLVLALAVVGLGLWLARWDGPAFGVAAVVRSSILGFVLFSAIGLWLLAHAALRGQPFEHGSYLVANVGTAGTLIGGLVGVYETRTRTAEAELELSREQLAFLNGLLRHHVLNGMQVIRGTLDGPSEEVGPAELDRIDDWAARISALVGEVSALSQAFVGSANHDPVDLEWAVSRAVETVQERYPTADVDQSVPPVSVLANEYLPVVFEQLLENAVEHHDGELPVVSVTAVSDEGTVTVEVSDDGPGIDPDDRQSVFERRERVDRHLGLYLVGTLVEWWDGSVRIDGNEPRGTVVSVTLPLAAPEERVSF